MAMTDDLSRVVSILVHQLVRSGQGKKLRYSGFGLDNSTSAVAKLCGTTPETVDAWEDGRLRPTVTQALTWMTVLYEAQGAPSHRPVT